MLDLLPLLGCLIIPLIVLAVAFALGYLVGADKLPWRIVKNDAYELGVDDGLSSDYI